MLAVLARWCLRAEGSGGPAEAVRLLAPGVRPPMSPGSAQAVTVRQVLALVTRGGSQGLTWFWGRSGDL